MKRFLPIVIFIVTTLVLTAQNTKAQSAGNCKPVWREVVWGDDLGYKGLLSSDLDNDGLNEIVVVSNAGLFWYVIKYDSVSGDYKKIWLSDYTEVDPLPVFGGIFIMDSDLDSEPEIVISLEHKIEIRNGTTYEIENIIEGFYRPHTIFMADADNDGNSEMVVQDNDKTILIIPGIYQEKLRFSIEHFSDVRCGDVDADGYNELIYSDQVTLLMPGDTLPATKWIFNPDETYNFDISDIDHDGIEEIIRCGNSLKVYDADNLKYMDTIGYHSQVTLIADLTGDGNKEILVDDGYSERILCINAEDGGINCIKDSLISVSRAAIGDTDNDGLDELILSYSDYNYQNNHLRIINPVSMEEEWQNNSSSYAIFVKIADIDVDNDDELIMISANGTAGLSSTNLTILNAVTKEVEFHSTAHISDATITGIAINDLDHDGIPEAIFCGYTDNTVGRIVVLDGVDHSIKSSHIYEDLYPFQTIRVADINNDGEFEFIVRCFTEVLVISSVDFTILKQYHLPGETSMYQLWVGNVDNDQNLEIVTVEDKIYIIDTQTDIITASTDKAISAISLFDFDNDGILEIIAGTKFAGKIGIFKEGALLKWLPVMDGKEISAVTAIAGPADEPLIVYQCDNFIKFMTVVGELLSSYDMEIGGSIADIETGDYNHDGITEIFANNIYEISEFSADCFPCFYFHASVTYQAPDVTETSLCEGKAVLEVANGGAPYYYSLDGNQQVQLNDTIKDLCAGQHQVVMTDNLNCTNSFEIVVEEVVGIEEKSRWNCRVYPIPASGRACIEFTQPVIGTATIYSVSGASLMTIPLSGLKTDLQLSSLGKGAYWLRIILDNGNIITKKLLVSL